MGCEGVCPAGGAPVGGRGCGGENPGDGAGGGENPGDGAGGDGAGGDSGTWLLGAGGSADSADSPGTCARPAGWLHCSIALRLPVSLTARISY